MLINEDSKNYGLEFLNNYYKKVFYWFNFNGIELIVDNYAYCF